jgi:hypothetical protein
MAFDPDAVIKRSAERGIAHVEANPGVSFEFNTSSILKAMNEASNKLDSVIEGNEGHSGSSFSAAFWTFVQMARDKGFSVNDDEASGVCKIMFAQAAAPASTQQAAPDVTTGSDITPMKRLQLKQPHG